VLTDDPLQSKNPTFDAALVDRRPVDKKGEWLLNASAAVIRLDVPIIKPDQEPRLLTLHASYTKAVGDRPEQNGILPSVNLVDGKAKQFDDGLYAALDLAYTEGVKGKLASHVQLIQRLLERCGKESVAAPYLAAGLELHGIQVDVSNRTAKEGMLREFRGNEVASKPIGFYTWSEPLADCFRFLRFFQHEFEESEYDIPLALVQALGQDKALLADYQKVLGFYARLTNPYSCLSVADILGRTTLTREELKTIAQEKNVRRGTVSLLPPSTSRETELFQKLFPNAVPPDVDLMRELVRKIRSGEVSLQPKPNSGWYDYQVYALETLLLPEKGDEKDKLLLTKTYKKRMLEAFKALMTKRRETHVRQLDIANAPRSMAPPPPKLEERIKPRLRVEPCPSYFLRTARAYAFLANFLESSVGKETLQALHGLKKDGQRKDNLYDELHFMRDLNYGLYLTSAEDIGMKPAFAAGETVNQENCYQTAVNWLATVFKDEDLAADTRVGVPIFVDANRGITRLWLTLGVRLSKLEANYARPPQIKPAAQGNWKLVENERLENSNYFIPVDEFAEVEIKGTRVLTREELREICDREKTKEAILKALQR
jgi:hypothetical protein